jgi:predicted dinucleotide-binding enzyme
MKFTSTGTGVIGTQLAPEQHRALLVAADCEEARRPGMRLVDDSGLAAYDAGVPAGSWCRQPMMPAHCSEPALKDLAPAFAAAAGTRPRATATGR